MTTCGSLTLCREASIQSSVARVGESAESAEADWKIAPEDIGEIVLMLLRMPERTLVSQVEVQTSKATEVRPFTVVPKYGIQFALGKSGMVVKGAQKKMLRVNVPLDPTRTGRDAEALEGSLRRMIVGQDEAIQQIVNIYQMNLTG